MVKNFKLPEIPGLKNFPIISMQKLSNRNNLNKIQVIKFLINKISVNKTEQPSENHSYLILKETVTLTEIIRRYVFLHYGSLYRPLFVIPIS